MSGKLPNEFKVNEQLKKLKVFVSHGIYDNVIAVQFARESNSYLKGLGINPVYKEYPEGHTISKAMLDDLLYWLKKIEI